MRILIQTLTGGLLVYLAYCCLLFLLQRHILFPRGQIGAPSPEPSSIAGLERIWLDTDFGKTEAWFLPPSTSHGAGRAPALIFAHGNAELIDFWPLEFKKITSLGIGVLLVEYPGYGRSQGAPSQKSITETFVAAYDAIVARNDVDPSRIVLLGRSLGGGAVCALAEKRPAAALILLSAFTSVRSLALNFLFPGFLVLDTFDNLSMVKSYPGPVLVVHGRNDNLIPYKHGTALCRAARQCRMLTYDCGHNDCPPSWDIFCKDVESFLLAAGIMHKSPQQAVAQTKIPLSGH